MSRRLVVLALAVAGVGCRATGNRAAHDAALADSAYAAVQARGHEVMGVDQYTSRHVFEDLPNGGRIVLEHDDSANADAITAIRRHMREVASDFRDGNFNKPFQVHARRVPGTDVMAARQEALTYTVSDRSRGAELRIVTADELVLAAVHDFLEFQRTDHRAAGHEGHTEH